MPGKGKKRKEALRVPAGAGIGLDDDVVVPLEEESVLAEQRFVLQQQRAELEVELERAKVALAEAIAKQEKLGIDKSIVVTSIGDVTKQLETLQRECAALKKALAVKVDQIAAGGHKYQLLARQKESFVIGLSEARGKKAAQEAKVLAAQEEYRLYTEQLARKAELELAIVQQQEAVAKMTAENHILAEAQNRLVKYLNDHYELSQANAGLAQRVMAEQARNISLCQLLAKAQMEKAAVVEIARKAEATNKMEASWTQKRTNPLFLSLRRAVYFAPDLSRYLDESDPHPEAWRLDDPHQQAVAAKFMTYLKSICCYVKNLSASKEVTPELKSLQNQCLTLAALFVSYSIWLSWEEIALPIAADELSKFYNQAILGYASSILREQEPLYCLLNHFAFFPLPEGPPKTAEEISTKEIKQIEEAYHLFIEERRLPLILVRHGTLNVAPAHARDIDLMIVGDGTREEVFTRFTKDNNMVRVVGPGTEIATTVAPSARFFCEGEFSSQESGKYIEVDLTMLGKAETSLLQTSQEAVLNVDAARVTGCGQAIIAFKALAAILNQQVILMNPAKTQEFLQVCIERYRRGVIGAEGATEKQKEAYRHILLLLKHTDRFARLGWEFSSDVLNVYEQLSALPILPRAIKNYCDFIKEIPIKRIKEAEAALPGPGPGPAFLGRHRVPDAYDASAMHPS